MSPAAGVGLRPAAAAGVGKSLWLSYAFAGPAGDASRGLPRDGEAGFSPRSCARSRSPGPESLGLPGVPAPLPEDWQSHRPRRHLGTASGRLGLQGWKCRRRCERSRDFVQGCSLPRAPHTARSPALPTARLAVPGLLPCGAPGLLFWTRDRAGSKAEAAFPARAAVRRARTAGSARRGSSQAPGKVAPRGGGGGWWAEAGGGGRR
ncbi:hypothetical protein HJG60_010669 [Phyllostomus discolor]|uniref:Uncharacterized protein n=1 Tax=Phyllostomus discolor TaxID=89673 RepID=A0A834ALR8_9CHIR|nr:hypothetical protein HJG60_010669 [Phyllostomus discolor]